MINFFNRKPRYRIYGGLKAFIQVFHDVVSGNVASNEKSLVDLEQRITDRFNCRYAISMPQARVGIYLTLKALIKPGQSVILSPYTIHDVVNMVICAGGVPVFADIERTTCNMSFDQVKSLIGENIGAVLVTHLHGLACDIQQIADFCKERNIPLVEDAAQAFGAKVNGKALGTFGAAGIFSFGMAKNVNGFYGGMVITDDDFLYKKIIDMMNSHPKQSEILLRERVIFCFIGNLITSFPIFQLFTFWLFRAGYLNNIEFLNKRWRGEDFPNIKNEIPENYLRKMTPMQARVILPQLNNIDCDSWVRLGYAAAYHAGLSGISEILTPPMRIDGSHIYLSYPIQVENPDSLLRFLMKQGRDLTLQHISNCADYECYKAYYRACPQASLVAKRLLLLPTYPSYGMDQVLHNIKFIRAFYGK